MDAKQQMDAKQRDRLNARLMQAVSSIPNKKVRADALAELESHVMDGYQSRLEQGLSPEAAFELSIQQLGDLAIVGSAFTRVYPPFYRQPLFWLASSFFMVAVILPLFLQSLSREFSHIREMRDTKISAKMEQFLQDQKRLKQVIDNFPAQGHQDLGKIMNFVIPWDGQAVGQAYPRSEIPAGLSQQLKSFSSIKWQEALSHPESFPQVDTAWLEHLEEYDRWEVFENSPISPLLARDPFNSSTVPMPDYTWISMVAKIHLLQAIHAGHPLAGLRDLRHLIRLLFTHEILVSSMNGIALLNFDRKVTEWLLSQKRLHPGDWTPVSEADTKIYKLAVFASIDVFDFVSMPAFSDRVIAERPIGLCAGLNEAFMRVGFVKGLLTESWPFETDYSGQFEWVESLLKSDAHGCRLVTGRAQWQHYFREIDPADFIMGGGTPNWGARALSKIGTLPYARRLAARFISTVATPFTRYWDE